MTRYDEAWQRRVLYPIQKPLVASERMSVAAALEVSPDHEALRWTEWAGRVFLNYHEVRGEERNKIARGIKRNAAALSMLLALTGQDFALRVDLALWKERGLTIDDMRNLLKVLQECATLPDRPAKAREELFLLHLARVWQEVRGRWPKRRNKEYEKFVDFVRVAGSIYAVGDDWCPWKGLLKRVCGPNSYPLRDLAQSEDLAMMFPE